MTIITVLMFTCSTKVKLFQMSLFSFECTSSSSVQTIGIASLIAFTRTAMYHCVSQPLISINSLDRVWRHIFEVSSHFQWCATSIHLWRHDRRYIFEPSMTSFVIHCHLSKSAIQHVLKTFICCSQLGRSSSFSVLKLMKSNLRSPPGVL